MTPDVLIFVKNLNLDLFVLLDRFLWEQKVEKKVRVLWQLLVGNFRQ